MEVFTLLLGISKSSDNSSIIAASNIRNKEGFLFNEVTILGVLNHEVS